MFGDSGGPAFVQLADKSWRVFGIDSEGTGKSCGAGDLMGVMHKAVSWIEQQSGVDITPCHDATALESGRRLQGSRSLRTPRAHVERRCAEPATMALCNVRCPFGGSSRHARSGGRRRDARRERDGRRNVARSVTRDAPVDAVPSVRA